MKFRWDKKYLYWGVTAFLVLASAILFYYFLFHGNNIKSGLSKTLSICMPIIYGLVLAYLETPIVNYMEKKWFLPICEKHNKEAGVSRKQKKFIRTISVVLTVLFMILIFYMFFAMVIPQLVYSLQNIAMQFPTYVDNLDKITTKLLDKNPELEQIASSMLTQYSSETESFLNGKLLPQLNVWLTQLSGTLFASVISLIRALWNLVIGVIISVYILFSKETFAGQCKKVIYALLNRENANETVSNIRFINRTFGGYISGKLADSLIIGLLCFIGMTFLQLPYTMLVSVIVGVTNIIPFFGPYIGAIPSALLILMVDPKEAFYFIIFILFLQQFDGNFLGPKILGNKTGLSSFWVIFSITVLGGYFGILGMAIGVPIFAVIYTGVKALTVRSLNKKGLSTNTSDYIFLKEIVDNEYIDVRNTDTDDDGNYEFDHDCSNETDTITKTQKYNKIINRKQKNNNIDNK